MLGNKLNLPRSSWRTAFAVLLVLASLLAEPARALESVTLQLKWTHAFQFAGYYAAKELGYYREAGLDVHIDEAVPGVDPLRAVLDGKAQYGIGMSSLMLVRQAGQPVVVLAVIFQHSPLVLIARETRKAQTIHDLVGKRVMIERNSDELLAYLKQEGISRDRLTWVEHSFNPADLVSGKVDAMSAYSTNEGYYFDQAKLPYQVYTPRSAGIDFYGDNLFTTERQIRDNPAQVEAFRAASLRGWRYAMDHPDEVAELIYNKYSQKHPLDFYRNEARRMVPLMRSELIEIGYMNPGRWRHIADTYVDLGLLPADFSLNGFLHQPDPPRDLRWLLPVIAGFVLVGLIVLYIVLINRRLAATLAASRRIQADLRESEGNYRMLAEKMADVIWVLDADTLRFRYVSPSVEKLRGYDSAQVVAAPLAAQLPAKRVAPVLALIAQRAADLRAGRMAGDNVFIDESELQCKDGSTVWVEESTRYLINPENGRLEVHGVSRDISQRRRIEDRMRQMAQQDALTGLANRAMFQDLLSQALVNAKRDRHRLALLFLDLDRFKPVNDSFGHGVGDQLLQAVARRIQSCVRESDTVARIGGDEFVVLLRNVDGEAAVLAVAEKIRLALNQPFDIAGHRLEIAASIGAAMYPEHGDEPLLLTKHADDAMYVAKAEGRNSVRLYVDAPAAPTSA